MLIVTHLHGTIAVSIYFILLGASLIWKHKAFWFKILLLVMPSGMLINVLAKHAFQRARPYFENPLLTLTTYSFPSGHVAASTLLYRFLAAGAIWLTGNWSRRVLVVMSAFALILLVAFSRMYLSVHYLSDVLAGFMEGIAWFSLCITGMHTLQLHQDEKRRLNRRNE